MVKTLYVNLFGAPGAGKSTTAAGTFAQLKLMGINAELVTEYAKDIVWEGSFSKLENQLYVFGKQYQRLFRVAGKVDVVVTDSPILLSTIYDNTEGDELKNLVLATHNKMDTVNFFLNRVKKYNPAGRMQTEEESDLISLKIKKMLEDNGIEYHELDGDESAMKTIATYISVVLSRRMIS